jgi:nitrous oxide reductase
MKIYLLLLVIVATLAACSDDNSSPKKVKATVPITLLEVDDTGTTGEEVELHVTATAYNGCYSDLEILLEESDERHYILSASAMRTKSNVCPQNLVIRDTVIRFTPQQTGSYYFAANKPGLTILRDTLVVE